MNFRKVKLIKKYHTILSLLVFISMISYGVFKVDLSIYNHPLSKLGTHNETNATWILSLVAISFVMWVNSINYIIDCNLKYKKITSILFTISSISLVGVALISMDQNYILHNIFAALFFFGYMTSIFFTGMQMIKTEFRIAMVSIIISILMMASGIWLLFQIKSIPELFFIILSFLWNLIILHPIEFKNLLKKANF